MEEETDEPVYVIDDTQKNATPAGMISRRKLAHQGPPPDRPDEGGSDNRVIILAAVGLFLVIVLGLVGVVFNGAESTVAKIEADIEAQKAAAPPGPEDIQGVKVRRGLQHEPNQPAKRSDLQPVEPVDDGVEEVPLNEVPDGAPPHVAPPEGGQL